MLSEEMMDQLDGTDCARCPIGKAVERRAFLRDAIASALVAIGSLGIFADRAAAMPIAFARGLGTRADKTYPIPATDGVIIDKDESLIIARADGKLYAFSLACPHQNTAIRWEGADHRFQCPKHHSRYRADGTFIEGRATRGLDRFAVKRDGNNAVVNLDALYREDENAAQWAAAFVALT
jgi:Rieske Fe-S protein